MGQAFQERSVGQHCEKLGTALRKVDGCRIRVVLRKMGVSSALFILLDFAVMWELKDHIKLGCRGDGRGKLDVLIDLGKPCLFR